MAIKTINDSLPSGDTPRQINKKINDNFSNTEHAASRIVGTATGNVMQVGAFGLGRGQPYDTPMLSGVAILSSGFRAYTTSSANIEPTLTGETVNKNMPTAPCGVLQNAQYTDTGGGAGMHRIILRGHNMDLQRIERGPGGAYDPVWSEGVCIYTGGNTTIDSNKNIKTSSPVVRVFSDHLDKIHEANDLPIKYTRNGIGDYTIKGTTGLRENDWQIVIPKDDHDNQLIAFTIEDKDGTIKLKTFKRIFSMETFTFGPDLKSPLDIPEGRWVDLHFNDLPQEELEEPEPVEEPEEVVEDPVE